MKQSIKRKGFTLVELVIVIAVIAILAAVLIPTFVGVIDNANNSADVQLAANLNTALADAQVYPDEVASAQNIRNHIKTFGYEADDLKTKRKDNVIAFNKKTGHVEVLDVSKIEAGQLIHSYYAEEVIKDYIIFSTAGNELAEALYAMQNLPEFDTSAGASVETNYVVVSKSFSTIDGVTQNALEYFSNALGKIPNNLVRQVVAEIVNSTIYVDAAGKMFGVTINTESVDEFAIENVAPITTIPNDTSYSRVVFSDQLEAFDQTPFYVAATALQVIVPQHVDLIGAAPTSYEDIVTFAGHVGANIPSEKVNSVEEMKSLVEENNPELLLLYNKNQVYTSDFNSNFHEALEMAKKIHGVPGKENEPIRLVVNGHVTITGAETIPDYVDVQIPFALGNSVAKAIMTYESGDMLGGKALGEAYPANDSENLNKKDNNKLYYLCGEGPGGGYDQAIQQYLEELQNSHADTLPDGWNEQSLNETLAIFKANNNISTKAADFSLSIAKGATLNIVGNLTIGAVIGYPDASGYQGHTSGNYGYIENNGTINVQKGGILDVWGFVQGGGTVNALAGALVYQPFVVTDYLDTLGVLWLFPFAGAMGQTPETGGQFNSPFMRYTLMNIQSTLNMSYGSALYGRANLIVFSSFLYCRASAPLVTSAGYILDTYTGEYKTVTELTQDGWALSGDKYTKTVDGTQYTTTVQDGAFQLSDGASLSGTYNSDRKLKITSTNSEKYEYEDPANAASLAGDIGVTDITLNGNIKTCGIQMDLLGGISKVDPNLGDIIEKILAPVPVNTAWCVLPVSYYLNITVKGNLTIGNGNKYAIMPGSKVTVAKGAGITIEEGSALYVVDGYDNSEMFKTVDKVLERYSSETENDTKTYIFDLGTVFFPVGLARKYYPSSTLLTNNGFNTFGELLVEGTITVNAGGDLGGTVNSGSNGKIILQNGAGVGKVLNLGGPYMSGNMFYTQASLSQQLDLGMNFLTTVSVPCFLNVYDTNKQNLITADYYEESDESPLSMNEIGNQFTLAQDSAVDIFKITQTSSNALTYSYKSHVLTQALTLTMGTTSVEVSVPSVKMANVIYSADPESSYKYILKVEDKTVNVNATYNGGWAVA